MFFNHSWTQDININYFPIQVGNTWYYDHPDSITNPWDILTISDTVIIKNDKYYIWSRGSEANVTDTIFSDNCFNIYRYIDGETYLWFDFSQDSGSVYTYWAPDVSFGPDHYEYDVHVTKNMIVETPADTFIQCAGLFFDIPQVIDEEHMYIFAPDVGLVLEQSNGWWANFLYDYVLYPIETSVHHHRSIEKSYILYQNYPNPFNPVTAITFSLPKEQNVQLKIFNMIGQLITTLYEGPKTAGTHTILWDGSHVPSSVYYCQLQAGEYTKTIKMILIR